VQLFPQLDIGRRADVDDRHSTGQPGDSQLQVVPVVLVLGTFQFALDLADPRVDIGFCARPTDECGRALGDGRLRHLSEVFDAHVLQGQARLGADHRSAQQGGQIFQLGNSAVAEPGCPHHNRAERVVHIVGHEHAQRRAVLRSQPMITPGLSYYIKEFADNVGCDGESALTETWWGCRSYAAHDVRCSSAAFDPPYPGSTPPVVSP
jgi:hypothetical protein